MKSYILAFILLLIASFGMSQSNNFPIGIVLTEPNENLKGKLTTLATQGGFSSASPFSRFILTAKISETNKEVASSAPMMVLIEGLASLYVVDNYNQKVINSIQVPLKGLGKNEQKATIKAQNSISIRNSEISNFLKTSRSRLQDYYSTNCDQIIIQAEQKSEANKFDEALLILSGIPMESEACFAKARKTMSPIIQKKIDADCKSNLMKAKNLWNANQTLDAANEVARYLNKIEPNAACFNQASTFSGEVRKDVRRLHDRNWDFKVKKLDSEIDLQEKEIEMTRAIGVAYGNNQPDKEVNIDWVYR